MEVEIIHIAAVVLFVLKIITGMSLHRKGRPVPTGALNLHKFIALGTFAVIAMIVRRLYEAVGAPDTLSVLGAVLTSLVFLAAILTGGLLSTTREPGDSVRTVHKLTPWLAAVFILMTVYFLIRT